MIVRFMGHIVRYNEAVFIRGLYSLFLFSKEALGGFVLPGVFLFRGTEFQTVLCGKMDKKQNSPNVLVVKMERIDWAKIKAEYIAGEGSYRSLAKKYGIGTSRLGEKAKEEKWVEERKKAQDSAVKKAVRKSIQKNASALDWLGKAKEKLAAKLALAVDRVDVTDAQAVRQIVAAVKDAQIVLNDKTDAQIREQEARIRNLEKQAESEQVQDKTVHFELSPVLEEYSK